MSWIESHQSLSRHRKTMAAAELLNVDRHKLIGHLHELWWWGIDNADINGVLVGIRDKSIAAAAGWPDKTAAKFTAALVEAGFLESRDGRYVLHNWYKYAGKLNERRTKERQRQADRRAADQQPANVAPLYAVQPEDVGQTLVGTVPTVPTVPTTDPSDQSAPGKRARTVSRKTVIRPPDALQPSETRFLTEQDISELEWSEPTIRVRDMAQDYIDWQEKLPPSHAQKHTDQLRGFKNQLGEQWRRDKFSKLPQRPAQPEPYRYTPRMSPFLDEVEA